MFFKHKFMKKDKAGKAKELLDKQRNVEVARNIMIGKGRSGKLTIYRDSGSRYGDLCVAIPEDLAERFAECAEQYIADIDKQIEEL